MSDKNKANDVNVRILHFVYTAFIESADMDYVMGRFAAKHALAEPFSWNRNQCFEKYLKAALLLNDMSTRKFGHDLSRLYEELCKKIKSAEEHFDKILHFAEKDKFNEGWFRRPFKDYLAFANSTGSSEVRYRNVDSVISGVDIHILDRFVLLARRFLIQNNLLKNEVSTYFSDEFFFSEIKELTEDWMISPSGFLESIFQKQRRIGLNDQIFTVFSDANFAFYKNRQIEKMDFFTGFSWRGSSSLAYTSDNWENFSGDAKEAKLAKSATEKMKAWLQTNVKI